MDIVMVGQCIFQPFQHNYSDAIAVHGPCGVDVKRPAVSIWRKDGAFFRDMSTLQGKTDSCGASQGHIAFSGKQGLAGGMHGHQTCGTCGLYRDAWASEIQLVRDMRGEKIAAVGETEIKAASFCEHIRARPDMRQQPGAYARACINADTG